MQNNEPSLSKTEHGFCDGDEDFTFVFHTMSQGQHHGELHIKPPAGLRIGLNVGRIFEAAPAMLDALTKAANVLSMDNRHVDPTTAEAVSPLMVEIRAALATATGQA